MSKNNSNNKELSNKLKGLPNNIGYYFNKHKSLNGNSIVNGKIYVPKHQKPAVKLFWDSSKLGTYVKSQQATQIK